MLGHLSLRLRKDTVNRCGFLGSRVLQRMRGLARGLLWIKPIVRLWGVMLKGGLVVGVLLRGEGWNYRWRGDGELYCCV